MEIHWLKHKNADKAHGFVQLGGGGVKPWIVSLCRKSRFRPGDFSHHMHEPFTKDMLEDPDDFCSDCIERFSKAVSRPTLQLRWPSVKCPDCGNSAWLTDSPHIIVCETCEMNLAFTEPLYDKEPKTDGNDQSKRSPLRPGQILKRRNSSKDSESKTRDGSAGPDRADGVDTSREGSQSE